MKRKDPMRPVVLTPADCTPDGRETIEHFIARGGRVDVIPAASAAPAAALPAREAYGRHYASSLRAGS